MVINFSEKKDAILTEYENAEWIEESGLGEDEILALVKSLENQNLPRTILKAKIFETIINKSRISLAQSNIFQAKINGLGILGAQRLVWQKEVLDTSMKKEAEEARLGWDICGTHFSLGDYGHNSSDTKFLLEKGIVGILEQIENAEKRSTLTEKQKDFYLSCKITMSALITAAKRLSEAILPYNERNAKALANVSSSAPSNIYEAMQLLVLYFYLHEFVFATRIRTLGKLDVLLQPFFENDIEKGTFTKSEIKELLKYFLYTFWCIKVPFDLPFALGGIDENAKDVTSEISYMIVEAYNELNIHSPKIHIKVSPTTPIPFLKKVFSYIRGGNSSFVFINDEVAVKSLEEIGIEKKDALNYIPTGCYEPAVWGVEMGCAGNAGISLPKMLELVFCNGHDLKTGKKCSVETGDVKSFEDFVSCIKTHLAHITETAINYVLKIEKHYSEINPEPFLSSLYKHSIEKGLDVYEGGAKYNNSSVYFISLATLIDSMCVVKKLVFDDKVITFDELSHLLKNNWEGGEHIRERALQIKEKFGNENELADSLSVMMCEFISDLVNNKPNSRGGVFKAGLFTVDQAFIMGKLTMATPDGRFAGEPLSKNLCACVGMDKKGITSLINSVCKIPLYKFSDGSVLDLVFHPTTVSGEKGLDTFTSLLKAYFKKGGLALHCNVFDANTLKDAQRFPDKYKTLQVRLCGWNAYFVELTPEIQETFIKQAERKQ